MKINFTNIKFGGNIYFEKPDLWTNGMLAAIANNESIQNKLEDNDIVARISTKTATDSYINSFHRKGDTLYKVSLVEVPEAKTLLDKVLNFFGISKKVHPVNKHYHSAHTTCKRLENLKI